MEAMASISEAVHQHDLTFYGETSYVYHCHHFNLFHDQTIDDALGEARAFEVKTLAAHAAARPLIAEIVGKSGAVTPAEKLGAAAAALAYMGHGKVDFSTDGNGGQARGEYLHYGFTWREKYGDRVRRRHPADAFALGFSIAATEVAFDLPFGALEGRERECISCREAACQLQLSPCDGKEPSPSFGRSTLLEHVGRPLAGLHEERLAEIAAGLKGFVAGIPGDDRGLIQGFGLYVTRHLAAYYNATAYDTMHEVEQARPEAAPIVEELFGESGHVCAFNTFGNILLSPEWEGMVGPLRGDVEEIVVGCTAIARGLGFGHWVVSELVPGQRLVMQTTSSYEAPYYVARYGRADRPRSYFFANAARAIMQLAHRVDWASRPVLDDALYQSLFRSGLAWKFDITKCLTQGDDRSEVVVTKREQ